MLFISLSYHPNFSNPNLSSANKPSFLSLLSFHLLAEWLKLAAVPHLERGLLQPLVLPPPRRRKPPLARRWAHPHLLWPPLFKQRPQCLFLQPLAEECDGKPELSSRLFLLLYQHQLRRFQVSQPHHHPSQPPSLHRQRRRLLYLLQDLLQMGPKLHNNPLHLM